MLRDYQVRAIDDACAVLAAGGHALFVAPTGCGKSRCIAAVHERTPGLVTLMPSLEILRGVYALLATPPESEDALREAAEARGLWTVMRFHNALMRGMEPPSALQFDEGHHTTAGTYETLHALCGGRPAVAWTATGFRGTPEETRKLRAKWGDPRVVLTLKAAVDRGFVSAPDMRVWPLLDDETIAVRGGEFEVRSVESALTGVLPALCDRIRTEFCTPIRRPVMVTAPGVASALAFADCLGGMGVPVAVVTGDTADRQDAFRRVVACEAVLIQVNVVSEGVDLPIRVQIDAAPTMSPVRWMQRVGRITRPTDEPPVYVACNHNLSRHMYLYAGVLPRATVAAVCAAWGPGFKPSRRLLARAIGLEGLGKFAVSRIPLADGTWVALYALQAANGTKQYAVLLHSAWENPLYFARENPYTGETAVNAAGIQYKVKDWGKWKRVSGIPDLDGWVSTKPNTPTEPMLRWWASAASRYGLDASFTPNAREFQVLPILRDTGVRCTV